MTKLLRVEDVARQLAECRDIDEIREIRDKAKAIEAYLRSQGASIQVQSDASEMSLRATRRLGQLCKEVTGGSGRKKATSAAVLLRDLDITYRQSSKWQKVASVDDAVFEAYVQKMRQKAERLTLNGAIKADPSLGGAVSHGGLYDSDEWYTPTECIEAARKVLGGLDLDPASNKIAQRRVRAKRYFTKDDDGLTKKWSGRVWLNPPYSQPLAAQFGAKLIEEVGSGRVAAAILVQNASTDTGWFHDLAGACSCLCLTKGRINFLREDGASSQNRYGQAFFYFGPNAKAFRGVFQHFGLVGKLT